MFNKYLRDDERPGLEPDSEGDEADSAAVKTSGFSPSAGLGMVG